MTESSGVARAEVLLPNQPLQQTARATGSFELLRQAGWPGSLAMSFGRFAGET
jgi:hypothetical protein